MREIKFRWWSEKVSRFFKFDLKKTELKFDVSNSMGYIEDSEDRFYLIEDLSHEWEQYTGIKDKNDKDIYEGDIIHEANIGLDFEVKYHKGGFWCFNKEDDKMCLLGLMKATTIIGNTHEKTD